jgi:hypothetical protein
VVGGDPKAAVWRDAVVEEEHGHCSSGRKGRVPIGPGGWVTVTARKEARQRPTVYVRKAASAFVLSVSRAVAVLARVDGDLSEGG